MATRRRDILPGKEKKTTPSPSPIHSTKTSTSASASSSPSPSHPKLLRPTTTRIPTTTDVSKHLAKKPSSTHSPAPDRTKSLEKKIAPLLSSLTQKTTPQKTTRASTNPLPQSSSSPVLKTAASTKPAQDKDKNVKAPIKDAGKNRYAAHARPVSTIKKVGADVKKQGTQNTTSAVITKKQGSQHTTSAINKQVNSAPPAHKKVKHTNGSEVEHHEEDFFLAEFDDPTVEDLRSHNEHEFSESFSYEQSEDENVGDVECSKVLEHQDEPIGVETKVAEGETCIEEVGHEQHEFEEYAVDEVKSVGYNADGENDEEVEEEVEEEEDTVLDKKAAASGREAHEFQETGGQQEVEEKKTENAAPKQEMVEEKKQESKIASEEKIVEEKKQKSENVHPKEETVEEKKQESENKPPNQEIAVENKKESENEPHKQQILEENKQKSENAVPQQEVLEVKKQESEDAPHKQVVVEKKQEPENAVQRLQVQGKKGGSPVSNDVIEETAIKLREQRKNKVKALAQAFENVIALQ